MLDLETVQAFVSVAELRSFTRAAEALGTTQPVISARLKKLEASLGRRLLDRHPRMVRLSSEGDAFLPAARDLLLAHERAISSSRPARLRLRLGISEHVAGRELPDFIARMSASTPHLLIELHIGLSPALIAAYDEDRLDAVIARSDQTRREGEFLRHDSFGWFAAANWRWRENEPLPIISVSAECGMRASAIQALEAHGFAWSDAFSGGGIAAVSAAVLAGLGVAPMSESTAPSGAFEVGAALGLPVVPASRVILLSHLRDPAGIAALRSLSAALRGKYRSAA
jgi:DNA-binding transcriptional LysR family regulator